MCPTFFQDFTFDITQYFEFNQFGNQTFATKLNLDQNHNKKSKTILENLKSLCLANQPVFICSYTSLSNIGTEQNNEILLNMCTERTLAWFKFSRKLNRSKSVTLFFSSPKYKVFQNFDCAKCLKML